MSGPRAIPAGEPTTHRERSGRGRVSMRPEAAKRLPQGQTRPRTRSCSPAAPRSGRRSSRPTPGGRCGSCPSSSRGSRRWPRSGRRSTVFGSARVGRGQRGVRARAHDRRRAGEGRVRGHHRRWPGRDGGRQPRRPRGRRAVDRLQHRAAPRAAPQPVRRPVDRVPLLLRAQDDVREVLRRVRDHARRLRHARRAVRGADADPDRQDPPLPGGPDGARLLGRPARLDARRRSSRRGDQRGRPRPAPGHRRSRAEVVAIITRQR